MDGSKRRTTLLGWIIHRSSLVESAASSDIHLAEVMATKKATLRVRSLRLLDSNSSNGPEVSASRTLVKSHVG